MHLVSDWLVDTFVYTGALIAAVLLLRGPVSRHFGPQVAYALWALPLLRFVMPPLVLPAWMAPAPEPALAAGGGGSEPLLVLVTEAPASSAAPTFGALDLLVPLWLIGAALFLAWRTHSYLVMRRELLAEARPVGEAGRVRLVETPAVASPLAFGVLDKVVALPPRFMAHLDREARDLAIAHELAHHRGHDLLANIAAQPLLALHWFNPLAWAGWRAMRRDQEAACDARVVAGRGRTDRALYASVIAGFAAGDNRLALAAPMACRVRGEKSIIHRLRSLASTEVPAARRRSGLLAIGAMALGLPLTASITYAQPSTPAPPAPPAAPAPPAPPAAPVPPSALESIDPDLHAAREPHRDGEERRRYTIIRHAEHGGEAAEHEGRWPGVPEVDFLVERDLRHDFGPGSEFEAQMREHEQAMAEMDRELREHDRELAGADRAHRASRVRVQMAMRDAPRVSSSLHCEGDEPVIERDLGDGRRAIIVCNNVINHRAVEGLREARRAIERNSKIPAERREELLDVLDEQIEDVSGRQLSVSLHITPMVPRHKAPLAPAAMVLPAAHLQAAIANLHVEACADPGLIV